MLRRAGLHEPSFTECRGDLSADEANGQMRILCEFRRSPESRAGAVVTQEVDPMFAVPTWFAEHFEKLTQRHSSAKVRLQEVVRHVMPAI